MLANCARLQVSRAVLVCCDRLFKNVNMFPCVAIFSFGRILRRYLLSAVLAAISAGFVTDVLAQQPDASDASKFLLYIDKGHEFRSQGRREAALKSYRAALKHAEDGASADPNRALFKNQLWLSYMIIGDFQRSLRKLDEALESYKSSVGIAEPLVSNDPENARWLQNIEISHVKIGHIYRQKGDNDSYRSKSNRDLALKNFRRASSYLKRHLANDPDNAKRQRDQSHLYRLIGEVERSQGNSEAALKEYRFALEITGRLAARYPRNLDLKRDLSWIHSEIGYVHKTQWRPAAALKSYRAAVEITNRLLLGDPRNAEWLRDLSEWQFGIGAAENVNRRRVEAVAAYKKGLEILDSLVARFPDKSELKRNRFIMGRELRAMQGVDR